MISYDQMTAFIREYLQENICFTANGDGTFIYEIDADYRDEMSDATAVQILKAPDANQALWETLEDWYINCEFYYREELEDNLRTALTKEGGLCPDGLTNEEDDQLQNIVMELVYFTYPEDHYLNQKFYVNILVDTGDGNYDFVLNDVYPAYCGHYGEPLDDKASIVWLAKTQGYTKTQLRNALKAGDLSDPKGFLETMRVEVANISTHMNALAFLVRLSLRQLIFLNKLIRYSEGKENRTRRSGYIILGKETETGLYDPWSGGGSCFGIKLEQDVKLPVRYIRSALPDGGDGYSIESVYGMCGTAWERGVLSQICVPKKLLSA